MIATLGSVVTVRLFRDLKGRDGQSDYVTVRASVVSAGPPGVVGDWARTLDKPARWLLIRKPKDGLTGHYDAVEGDMGKFG
jgi:hypothetical protein